MGDESSRERERERESVERERERERERGVHGCIFVVVADRQTEGGERVRE